MKSFIVIGLGRFGLNLALTLNDLGHEVLTLDRDEEKIQKVSDYVTHSIVGEATDEDVLRSIGVRNFDCAVVALSSDIQASVLVTLLLKELGVKTVIAKAQSEVHKRLLDKVGADSVVFPERDMGVRYAHNLSRANIVDFIEISDIHSIMELTVPEKWIGKTLRDLNLRDRFSINVMAIKDSQSGNIDISPNPDAPLSKEDIIILIGANDDIEKMV